MAKRFKSALLRSKGDLEFYWPQMRPHFRSRVGGVTKSLAIKALKALNERLVAANKSVVGVLIGGGAMMFFNVRAATDDLDVIPMPPSKETIDLIHKLQTEVQGEIPQLPVGWINAESAPIFVEQAKRLEPGDLRPYKDLEFSNLKIYIAIPEALLAMKLQALRPERDLNDIRTLCKMLGIRTYDQMFSVVGDRFDPAFIGNDEERVLRSFLK